MCTCYLEPKHNRTYETANEVQQAWDKGDHFEMQRYAIMVSIKDSHKLFASDYSHVFIQWQNLDGKLMGLKIPVKATH